MAGMENTAGFGLFPNPTMDGFKLVSENIVQADRILISDATGRIFWTSGSTVTLPLNLSAKNLQLGSGVYVVTIDFSGQQFFLRLVVE